MDDAVGAFMAEARTITANITEVVDPEAAVQTDGLCPSGVCIELLLAAFQWVLFVCTCGQGLGTKLRPYPSILPQPPASTWRSTPSLRAPPACAPLRAPFSCLAWLTKPTPARCGR